MAVKKSINPYKQIKKYPDKKSSLEKYNEFISEIKPYLRLKNTIMTNFLEIGICIDERTNKLIVISAQDNLVKGASGQAVQNMNLMFGLPETEGLL